MSETCSIPPSSFYLFAPKAQRFFSFSRGSGDAGERVKALLRTTSAGSDGGHDNVKAAERLAAAPLAAATINESPASYSLAGGAVLVVRFGLCEVAGLGLHHMQPNVHYEPSTRTACVFIGHLSNLDELSDRYGPEPFEGPTSPNSILAARGTSDPRQLAAEIIMRMYLKERGGDLLVLLSELQGQYSFAIYDSEKRQVFAARDSSGSEPLYYELDDDSGALSLSNAQPAVPADVGYVQWTELPPGHFISGRTPKLQQFALTPAQLSIRENYERSMDEEMSPRAFVALSNQQELDMRRSLSSEPGAGGDDGLFVY